LDTIPEFRLSERPGIAPGLVLGLLKDEDGEFGVDGVVTGGAGGGSGALGVGRSGVGLLGVVTGLGGILGVGLGFGVGPVMIGSGAVGFGGLPNGFWIGSVGSAIKFKN
jgi:hypothetical protein